MSNNSVEKIETWFSNHDESEFNSFALQIVDILSKGEDKDCWCVEDIGFCKSTPYLCESGGGYIPFELKVKISGLDYRFNNGQFDDICGKTKLKTQILVSFKEFEINRVATSGVDFALYEKIEKLFWQEMDRLNKGRTIGSLNYECALMAYAYNNLVEKERCRLENKYKARIEQIDDAFNKERLKKELLNTDLEV